MKTKIFILWIGLICIFCIQGKAQKQDGFIITGQFKGLPDGTKVYLTTQEKDTVAKAISKRDQFTFSGKLEKDGRFHFIKFDTLVSKVSTKAIFVVNKTITVSGTVGIRPIVVEGSEAHADYARLIKESEQIKGDQEKTEQVLNWIEQHKSSLYAPYVIMGYSNTLKSEGVQKAYENLSLAARQSYYGLELKNQIDNSSSAAKIQKDKVIPNFSLISTEGNSVKIHDLAAKSKITLIDFWASWCGPCREAIPSLKQLYEIYKDKGFNIVGASTDKNDIAWKKALKEEQTPWFNGIDKNKVSSQLFDAKAIPAYVLIDNTGKMIAFDCAMSSIPSFGGSLHGESLKQKLEDLLRK